MRHVFFIVSCLLMTLQLMGLWGCASKQTVSSNLRESEYRRMMELQRQKTAMAMAAEEKIARNIPEMTAGDLEMLGDNYIRRGNITAAFLQYQKSIRLDPRRITARYKLGNLCLRKGLTSEASKEFEEIMKIDPKSALAREGQARVYLANSEWEKAKENFRQALGIDPNLWQSYAFLATIYNREKNYDAAVEAYHKGIAVNGNSSMLYNNLGINYLLMGEYESSAEAFLKALKIEPENRKIYNNFGISLCRLKKDDSALEAFMKAGDKAGAYNNLGYFYMNEERYEEAIAAFENAIEAKPSYYVKAQDNLKRAKLALTKIPLSIEK